MSLTEQFDSLAQAVGRANHGVRLAQDAQRVVEADVARLTDAIQSAYAQGRPEKEVTAAKKERARREQDDLRDALDRLEGARRAAQAAEVERDQFAIENADALLRERREVHHESLTAIEDVKLALVDLVAKFQEEQAHTQRIQRAAQRQSDRFPTIAAGDAELVRQLRRQPRATDRVAA